MSSVFPLPNEGVQNIKDKITKMFCFLFWKINYEEDSEENDLTKCLRQEAIKWACILGESECQRVAHDRLLKHIQKLKTNKYYRLLPWWEEWIYCKGLMLANSSIWHEVVEISFSEDKIDRFSEFLACAPNNVTNEHLGLLMLKKNEDFDEIYIKRHINSFLFIIAKHAKHNDVLSNILRNFDKLKPRGINGVAMFIILVNHVYSREQLVKIRGIMREIIEVEAYKFQIKHICKKTGSLFDSVIIEASFDEYKDLVEEWIYYANYKLQTRSSQIEKQISYLQTFLEKER